VEGYPIFRKTCFKESFRVFSISRPIISYERKTGHFKTAGVRIYEKENFTGGR
jgi:hypothetical protein